MLHIQDLIDDAKCFETVRAMRWPDGIRCPECDCAEVTKDGRDDTQSERQRYQCHGCWKRFDDLTGTGDFLSEGGQARTVSAVDAEAVGGTELLLLQRFASASRAALAVQSVRAVHWSWHRQRESPPAPSSLGTISPCG